jgi:osmotically-inducible protein OsmY
MKSDSQLQRDLIDEMHWDPQLSKSEIGIAVRDGVVTLSGTVHSFAQKLAAERAAERVSGVKAIADDLIVQLDGFGKRSDTDIAHAAVNALKWDSEVPEEDITIKVDNGWITLDGRVPWRFQSDAAERAVRYLIGVKGVTNMIRVQPSVSTASVKSRIEDALKRSAQLDAQRISVQAADGKITLNGTVRSWAERRDAERAAWAAPGVTQVEDRLVIAVE